MPIGFWAISRDDVRETYKFRTGREPTRETLDRIVKLLRNRLDTAVEDEVQDEIYSEQHPLK